MSDPLIPPVSSHNTHWRVIVDHNGQRVLIGGSEETSTLGDDGAVRHEWTDMQFMTLDGHVVDYQRGDTAHVCPVCGVGPFSRQAMTTCQACRRFVCVACATTAPAAVLCAVCHKAARRQALKNFFLSIF